MALADVAELADALDLGSSAFGVQVRFLSSAPSEHEALAKGFFLCQNATWCNITVNVIY